jgi:biotin carboxyl carrier protein
VKTYQVNVNGRPYDVEIENLDASPVEVRVNGQSFKVTIADQGTARPQTQARPSKEPAFDMDAYVPAVTTTYQEIDIHEAEPQSEPVPADTHAAGPQGAGRGTTPVSAPMPGTILDIAVKVGDTVQQGDTLCNLEAMKMKSPIRSPGEGTIAQVMIAEGQNVGYGDVLFTLS